MRTTRLERLLAEQRQARRQRILVFAGILILIGTITIAGYFLFGGMSFRHKAVLGMPFPVSDSKINILVLGINHQQAGPGEMNEMVLVSVDRQEKSVCLLLVPQDTRIFIPDYGWGKVNATYEQGGHELAVRSVQSLLGLPIDYYVEVSFPFLSRIIDVVGGIDIITENPGHSRADGTDLPPGSRHLDGQQAIGYAYDSMETSNRESLVRQQKIVQALHAKLTSASVLTRVPTLWSHCRNLLKTDLTLSDALSLGIILDDLGPVLSVEAVPGNFAPIDGVNYWVPDIMTLRKQVAMIAGIPMIDQYRAEAQALAREYQSSIPGQDNAESTIKPEKGQGAVKPSLPSARPSAMEPLHAEVVNASGIPDTGNKVAAILQAKGIIVSTITVGDPVVNTVVISRSTNTAVLSKLTSLPFRYAFQVVKDDERTNLVTVIVGKNFAPD